MTDDLFSVKLNNLKCKIVTILAIQAMHNLSADVQQLQGNTMYNIIMVMTCVLCTCFHLAAYVFHSEEGYLYTGQQSDNLVKK